MTSTPRTPGRLTQNTNKVARAKTAHDRHFEAKWGHQSHNHPLSWQHQGGVNPDAEPEPEGEGEGEGEGEE